MIPSLWIAYYITPRRMSLMTPHFADVGTGIFPHSREHLFGDCAVKIITTSPRCQCVNNTCDGVKYTVYIMKSRPRIAFFQHFESMAYDSPHFAVLLQSPNGVLVKEFRQNRPLPNFNKQTHQTFNEAHNSWYIFLNYFLFIVISQ